MRPMHNNARRGSGGGRFNNNRGFNRTNNVGSSGGGNGGRPLNRNHSFDSVGPNGRLRGTAQQLAEKYAELSRSAAASGDYSLAENLSQHAEHYTRANNEIMEALGFNNAPMQNPQAAPGEFPTDANGAPADMQQMQPIQSFQPVQQAVAPQMPAEQPSLGDFEPPEFLRART